MSLLLIRGWRALCFVAAATLLTAVPLFAQATSTFSGRIVGAGGSKSNRKEEQIKDDVSLLLGTHAIKFGANYAFLPGLGRDNGNEHFATIVFFDDPSVILSNSNGRYPQGFATPGVVRSWL